jgi:excisionase family DNA binding protein
MSRSKPEPNKASGTSPTPKFVPNFTPRLLRITEAAFYLSCTFCQVETLIREKTVPSYILGRRRVIDLRDLDAYIDRLRDEAVA